MASKRTSSRAGRLKVGDSGTIDFGGSRIRVKVVEDRGCIDRNGGQLVRIRWASPNNSEPMEFEVPAESVRKIRPMPRKNGR